MIVSTVERVADAHLRPDGFEHLRHVTELASPSTPGNFK